MLGKKVNEEVIFDYKYNAYDNKYDEIKSYPSYKWNHAEYFIVRFSIL